ncbi:EAP30/Vps36 family-domain-containing protein [Peziza echinospora]|nr:EAP30/Vps36 family-domain-containing protein [Peziza echinospora]
MNGRKLKVPNYQNGCAYLTTHRACYVDNAEPRKYSLAVDIKDVDRYEFYAGFLRSSPKITLFFQSNTLSLGNLPGSSTSTPIGSSAAQTPRSSTPNIAPLAQRATSSTWICTICSFSNPIPSNYSPGVTQSSSIPPCLACGIRPQAAIIDKALLSQALAPATPPQSSPSSVAASPAIRPAQVSSSGSGFACPRCTFENHPSLASCEICGERLVSANIPDKALTDDLGRTDSPAPILFEGLKIGDNSNNVVESIKFSFRAGGAPVFYEKLRNVIIQRKWLLEGAPPVPRPRRDGDWGGESSGSGSSGPGNGHGKAKILGIAGLERQGNNVRMNNDLVMRGALDDLESLMSRAKEMVALAESFATRLASQQSSTATSEASRALISSTTALGISTFSKDQLSTDLYLSDLARQLAEFLSDDRKAILKREGGVITLVDLWAIYNRARGIDLISPSDLEKAAALFEKLRLPVRLRRFKSGLLVVQQAGHTDEVTVRKLVEWVKVPLEPGGVWGRGVTALDAAERFGWSVGVATEELEMAEEKGWLCREVGVEGVTFWLNCFVEEEGRDGGGGGGAGRESSRVV